MDELKTCPYTDEEVSQKLRKWKGHCQIPGLDELILWAADIIDRRAAPENKPLTCVGCVNNGLWENEVEYGYPSPCTGCKRRASDNYAHKPEEEEK